MSADVWYADSSAVVKTVVEEPESRALRRWLDGKFRLVASDVIRVEVVRAVRVVDPSAVADAWEAVGDITLIRQGTEIHERAALLEPSSLRSLDALHLATALLLGADLAGVLTYDRRMADGARSLGLSVASPGRR